MSGAKIFATCRWCGKNLSTKHTGVCPYCGKEGKNVNIQAVETIHISDIISLEHVREFYEGNKVISWFVNLTSFGSPFLGLYISGFWGVVIGLIISFIVYFLTPYTIVKVREIKKYQQ